ncbi:D-glycerate dehydrogenase [Peribacillus saganii]|uniref:D-glycerate dehydrogenase n=1 Tax=Peribacillus saganii TaxID=2303992 RepID=A0A372LPT4_9BACI|nr:D-glycerate dehydrogenase [Peribacillus saganii]RFU70126.1 D-glycerate dehydrogenase [Peribacillus saganii]
MSKIVVTRRIPKQALELLKENGEVFLWDREEEPIPHEVLLEEIKEAAGVFTNVGDRIDKELFDHAPNLKVVSTMAVGYDNIDVREAAKRGIAVGHTPGILTETTADLTFALLMATARRVVEGSDYVRQGRWKSWGPMLLTGQDIFGATIGIIGMGRIGEGVARRASGFNMNILYHNRSRRREIEESLNAAYSTLEELLSKSDFVVLLAPGNTQTRHIIGKEELKLMKPSSVFINASRGTNVDERALYEALKNEEIWAAGLDVFEEEPVSAEHPLLTLPNVTVLPHIGSASIATRTKMAVTAAQNLVAGIMGKELPFQVKINEN